MHFNIAVVAHGPWAAHINTPKHAGNMSEGSDLLLLKQACYVVLLIMLLQMQVPDMKFLE